MVMNTDDAFTGAGATLSWSVDSGTNWVEIPCVEEIDAPADEVTKVKRSHLKSPGKVNQYLPGFSDMGVLKAKVQFEKSRYTALAAIKGQVKVAGVAVTWKYTIDDDATTDTKWVFPGFLSKLPIPNARMEETAVMEIEVTATGAVTYTEGT
jgi:hypothetical protein